MARIETALITVSDKTGLPPFAQRLTRLGIGIISAGGTGRLLRENGIPFDDVADYTGLPEILDGRIKTLHHKVLAGLLALRDLEEHRRQMAEHDIRPIDMVVVNLYPLGQVITERAPEPMRAMVNIDIGGPTLIRAAAKNYTHVAVVTSPERYDAVADEMEASGGALSEETHFALCLEAFRHTAHYDQVVAGYLAGIHGDEPLEARQACDALPRPGEHPPAGRRLANRGAVGRAAAALLGRDVRKSPRRRARRRRQAAGPQRGPALRRRGHGRRAGLRRGWTRAAP